ncbi:MAG: hypothetical protein J6D02_05465 [Lachnospira sp.]|nr:hypothetical protein [Lachnospira sp.]
MNNNTLEFYPFRIFSQNGKNYIFSGEMSGIFEIDKKHRQLLHRKESHFQKPTTMSVN